MANENGNTEFTKGLLVGTMFGAVAGALTALLLAPKSGKELRQDIAERSGDIYDKASDYMSGVEAQVGNAVTTTVNTGRERAKEIINTAKIQADALLKNAENVLREAKSKASGAKDTVQNKLENVRDAAKASASAFRDELKSPGEEA
jgi:gas vesicle protein